MDGRARLVWKLARNHTWGTPMDDETLVRLATTDEDHDEMREQLGKVLKLPFVTRGPDGVYIPNGQDAHVEAANWLRENTERETFVIANTLSRLPPRVAGDE
jgi:sugar/nucleoside kinase (ribokinase family)